MMRMVILFVCMMSIALNANDAPKLFEKGCALYQENKFQQALDTWITINPKSSEVWFNLGSAAYHANKKIEAVVYWLRAKHSGALFYAQETMRELGIVDAFTKTWHQPWVTHISLLYWQVLVLLMLCIIGLLGARLARKRRWYMLGGLVAVLLMAVAGLCISYYDAWYPRALVVKEQVSYYAGPDEQFEALGQLPMGSVVKVIGHSHGWYKVRYLTHHGWAVRTTMALLNEET